METVIIVTLLIITLAMIGVILIQRSEGGGLGIGGGSSSMGGLMTSRGTKDFLTRTTAILAALFMGLCLILTILATQQSRKNSLLTTLANEAEAPAVNSQAEIDSALNPNAKEKNKAVVAPAAGGADLQDAAPKDKSSAPAKAPVA